MEIQYFGANCVRLTTKKASIVIDDNLGDLGLKAVIKPNDIALCTTVSPEITSSARIVIYQPGEYEASDASIKGIAARAHMDEEGHMSATIYRIIAADIRVAVVGHIHPDLTEEQLENIGTIDVLIVPVGGAGYTLDPIGALKVIKEISPKVIIPTHYADKAIKYPVPQVELGEAIKSLSMEPAETTPKLKLKAGEFAEATQLFVLERQ